MPPPLPPACGLTTSGATGFDPYWVAGLLAILVALGLRDKIPFLAARAEVYGPFLLIFLALVASIGGNLVWVLIAGGILMVLPVCLMAVYSFLTKEFRGGVIWDFTLAAYDQFFITRGLFGDEPARIEWTYIGIFWRSIWQAGLATLLCLFIGFPTAWFIATRPARSRATRAWSRQALREQLDHAVGRLDVQPVVGVDLVDVDVRRREDVLLLIDTLLAQIEANALGAMQ